MRLLYFLFTAQLATAGYARAMESDLYNNNPGPSLSSALVSFSIGYPKGWMVTQDSSPRTDIYYDIAIGPKHYGPICSFGQPMTNTLKNGDTFYMIWPSDGATAKAAAEKFIAAMKTSEWQKENSLNPIKTSAGDSGWLVESTGYLINDPAITKLTSAPAFWKSTNAMQTMIQMEKNLKPSQETPIIYHDFFFHIGNRGAIRIQMMTQATNSSWRSELDQLVLQTLRFNNN